MSNEIHLLKKDIIVLFLCVAFMITGFAAVGSTGRSHAKSIICKTNLQQWGLGYRIYANDYEGNLPPFIGGSATMMYWSMLKPYTGENRKFMFCPFARTVSESNPTSLQLESYFGSTFSAWQVDPTASWVPGEEIINGSYGENSWIRDSQQTGHQSWGSFDAMENPSIVPLILDARWLNAWPNDNVPVETDNELDFYNISNWSTMSCFAMRRHDDGVNAAMADMSVKTVSAEDLWTLKWHKEFEQNSEVDLSWMGSNW